MKFMVIAMSVMLIESLHIHGAEVNKTEEANPTGSVSPPEKRSIGGLLLPLLGGLSGMGGGEDSLGAAGGLLGMIGSLLSNRMGFGGGGLKVDINPKPPVTDNFGSSSNSYAGSAPSPGIAFNLDFGKIHDNLEKGLRIGKAAMSTGGSLLNRILQAQTSNVHYDMGPGPSKEQYPEREPPPYAASLRSGPTGAPPRHARQRVPPSGHLGLRGASGEVGYNRDPIFSNRPKSPKAFDGDQHRDYSDIIVGRVPQHADSGTANRPFYSESPKNSPPLYPERSSPSYTDGFRSSQENLRSSPMSYSEGFRSSSESLRSNPSYHEGIKSSPSYHEGLRSSPSYYEELRSSPSYHEGLRSSPSYSESVRSNPQSHSEGIRNGPSYVEGFRSNPESIRSSPASYSENLRSNPESLRSNPESLRSNPPAYSDESHGSFADYQETLPISSQEVQSGSRYRSHQAASGAETHQQGYPEDNEISTGSYQREEAGANRPSSAGHFKSHSNSGHEEQGQKLAQTGIQPAVAMPIGLFESSQKFASSVENAPESEYRPDYDQSRYSSDSRDYDGNFSGSQSSGRGGSGQSSGSYLQQQ